MRRNPGDAAIREAATQLGATMVEIGIGGKHRFSVVEHRGQRRRIWFASTPSDYLDVSVPLQQSA